MSSLSVPKRVFKFCSSRPFPDRRMSPHSKLPSDDFFNDLPRRTSSGGRSSSPRNTNVNVTTIEDVQGFVPRTKRIACVVCRKRKLSKDCRCRKSTIWLIIVRTECDGTKPRCGTCARLGHSCSYDEVRKKSGPKRGYVKHLEARLGTQTWRGGSVTCY